MSENFSFTFSSNWSEEMKANITEFIVDTLGPDRINWETLIPLTIIYSLFLV